MLLTSINQALQFYQDALKYSNKIVMLIQPVNQLDTDIETMTCVGDNSNEILTYLGEYIIGNLILYDESYGEQYINTSNSLIIFDNNVAEFSFNIINDCSSGFKFTLFSDIYFKELKNLITTKYKLIKY